MSKIGSGGNTYTGAVTINQINIPTGGITSAEIANGSIKKEDTDYITVGKNLFDKSRITAGKSIVYTTGAEATSAGWNATDYIPVTAGVTYTMGITGSQMAWYNASKVYISGNNLGWTGGIEAPAQAAYARFGVLDASINTMQIEVGSSATAYEEYMSQFSTLSVATANIQSGAVTSAKIASSAVLAANLASNAVTSGKISASNVKHTHTDFATIGKNLCNYAAMTAGKYINSSGGLNSNASYSVTDYIPVVVGTAYKATGSLQLAFYNSAYVFVSYVGEGYSGGVIAPAGAAYARFSCNVAVTAFQVEVGTAYTAYEPYGYKFTTSLAPVTTYDTPTIYLSSEVCVAVGTTIELYNNQVCISGDKSLHYVWACDIGKCYERKFSILGATANIGNHTLTLTVYDRYNNIAASGTTTLKVVEKTSTPASPRKVLCIGDSLTWMATWRTEMLTLATAKFGSAPIEFVGTMGTDPHKHEGRPGWNAVDYLANTAYVYEGVFQLTVSGVSENPDVGKKYTVPTIGVCTVTAVDITASSGTIDVQRDVVNTTQPTTTGTITETTTDGLGDATISYSSFVVTSRNPFWNSGTGAVDFANYSTVNSIVPDDIVIFLGQNGINASVTTNSNNIKLLIDAIRTTWATIPIYLVNTCLNANQDGIAITYGANGYYKLGQDKKIVLLASTLKTLLSAYTKIYYVPCISTMDAVYGYTQSTMVVNPRCSITQAIPSEAVHPGTDGFEQMADSMFSTWLAHYADV